MIRGGVQIGEAQACSSENQKGVRFRGAKEPCGFGHQRGAVWDKEGVQSGVRKGCGVGMQKEIF